MKQQIATTVLLVLIGCASAQDYNRFDDVPHETFQYTPEQRSADIFYELLGLGSPHREAIEMRMRIETHERNMRKRQAMSDKTEAIKRLSAGLARAGVDEDITVFNDIVSKSPATQRFLGGSFEAKPTGKKHEGDEIYAVRIFNPLTNENIITFNETAKGIIDWFYAYCSNNIKKTITQDGQTGYSNEAKPDAHDPDNHFNTNQRHQPRGFGHSWDNKDTYTRPYKHDAYGHGVNSDSTGRPFEYKTQDGQNVRSNKVKPDAYGLGVGMDEFGRPVKPSPWPSPLTNPYPNPYPNPWGQQ